MEIEPVLVASGPLMGLAMAGVAVASNAAAAPPSSTRAHRAVFRCARTSGTGRSILRLACCAIAAGPCCQREARGPAAQPGAA